MEVFVAESLGMDYLKERKNIPHHVACSHLPPQGCVSVARWTWVAGK